MASIAAMQSSIDSQYSTLINDINNRLNSFNEQLQQATNAISVVFNNIAPDYTRGYGIPSGFVAPCAGWIRCTCASSANYTSAVWINGNIVTEDWQVPGDGRAGTHYFTDMVFVAKNDVVTYSNLNGITFFPCRGA